MCNPCPRLDLLVAGASNFVMMYIYIIINKVQFRSNQMLDAQLVQLKKLGKENSQHKPTLEDEDMES